MKLRLEPYIVNLIWKLLPKVTKTPKLHLIFINFGVKNCENDPKNLYILIFDCHNLIDLME